jgi:hypothetical protein
MKLRLANFTLRPRAMRLRALGSVVAATMAAQAPAAAQEGGACHDFAWSLTREQDWFAARDLPAIESGGSAAAGRALVVKLRPVAEVAFAAAPERAPKTPDALGAAVVVDAPGKPGLYQVTLSEEAWIDVVQGGRRLESAAFTGRKGCPGLRKSVRFELRAEPLTLQISGATVDRVTFALAPANER